MCDVAVVGYFLVGALVAVYWLWQRGKIGRDTLERARGIRANQGNHEAEVTCGGEADLHKHFIDCDKNPGHSQFIPLQDFKKEHLPPGYHDNDIVDWIRAEADLTCRLSVRFTSKSRPKYHPGRPHLLYPFSKDCGKDWMRVGTGWLGDVNKYTEEDNNECECEECSRPGSPTPHKVWGKVSIVTARHVIFDDDEARRTTCHFGYDTSTTVRTRDCLTLIGFKVKNSDVIDDGCFMTYVTHDMEIVNKLYKMWRHSVGLRNKLYDKYSANKNTSLSVPGVSCLTDPKPGPVVIISQPHGLSKHLSVGMWTHRQTCSEIRKYKNGDGREADIAFTSYTYNAHTCPGSSGAAVMRLPEKGAWCRWFTYHVHSEGGDDNSNNNKSGMWWEFVSEPTYPT